MPRRRIRMMIECLCVVALLGAACLFAANFYLREPLWPKNFGLLDYRYYFVPNAFYLDTSLKNGEFPWWNPLAYCGMPFAADPQANAFYPVHLVRSLLTPGYNPYATAVSIQLTVFLHLLFCGLGMFLLARDYRLSAPSGLVGALIFLLGPYSVIYYSEFYVYALLPAWLPWLVLLMRRMWHARGRSDRILYAAMAALCFGVCTLAGFPQFTLYTGLILALLSVLDLWASGACKPAPYRALTRRVLGLVAVAVLGALVAAVLLLPAYELAVHSARKASAGLSVQGAAQNRHWFHLLKNLAVFPGNSWMPQGCRAAGIGSLLAALAALGHRRRRHGAVYCALYLVLTDCTLGPPFPTASLLSAVDVMNITVSPWRAGIYAQFGIAMAAAFGVHAVAHQPRGWRRRLARSGVLGAAASGLFYLFWHWRTHQPMFEPTFWVWVLPLAALGVMLLCAWRRMPRFGNILIALCISLEVLLWSAQMLPLYASPRIQKGGPETRFGKVREISRANRRVAGIRPNWQMFTLEDVAYGYNPLYVGATRKLMCKPGSESRYLGYLREAHVFVDNQRGNLFLKRSFWLCREWVSGPIPDKGALFPAATTVYLPDVPPGTALSVPEIPASNVAPHAVSGDADRIALGEGADLAKRVRGQPQRGAVLKLPPFEQNFRHGALFLHCRNGQPLEIRGTSFDEKGIPRPMKYVLVKPPKGQEAIVEIPLPDCRRNSITLQFSRPPGNDFTISQAYVLLDRADEDHSIAIDRRTPNSVDLTVSGLPGNRILLIVDSFYPGWHAFIDGCETRILRANDAFKAVEIPQGIHQVRLVYRPVTAYVGLAISMTAAASLLAVCAGALACRHKRATGGLCGYRCEIAHQSRNGGTP